MTTPRTVDNFIPQELQDRIYDLAMSDDMPWFYKDRTLLHPAFGDTFFFNHLLHEESTQRKSHYCHMIAPLYAKIFEYIRREATIYRSQFNMMTRKEMNIVQSPHIDHASNDMLTALYYVNDSDGDTVLYEQVAEEGAEEHQTELGLVSRLRWIKPKKGRMVFFRSNRFHSSTSPTTTNRRIVINTILKL